VEHVRHPITLDDAGGIVEGYDVTGAQRAEPAGSRRRSDPTIME